MITVKHESTPNPDTMKFVFSEVLSDKSQNYEQAQDTETSPLAAKIFGFPWASGVFVSGQFVTVSKQSWVDWSFIADPLAQLIADHVNRQEPLFIELAPNLDDDPNDTPLVRNIKSALNREIRPVVALDGGDIVFHAFNNGTLSIHMRGACAGCPSSTATLKDGIEVRMRELFPEIQEVVSV